MLRKGWFEIGKFKLITQICVTMYPWGKQGYVL